MSGVAAALKSLSSDNVVSNRVHHEIALLLTQPSIWQVQYILADIPFFCVGILSLGVFTFFIFMKRADR